MCINFRDKQTINIFINPISRKYSLSFLRFDQKYCGIDLNCCLSLWLYPRQHLSLHPSYWEWVVDGKRNYIVQLNEVGLYFLLWHLYYFFVVFILSFCLIVWIFIFVWDVFGQTKSVFFKLVLMGSGSCWYKRNNVG